MTIHNHRQETLTDHGHNQTGYAITETEIEACHGQPSHTTMPKLSHGLTNHKAKNSHNYFGFQD